MSWLLYLEECDDGLRVVVVLVLHGLTGLGLDQQLVDDHTNQSSSTTDTSAIGRATFAMPAHACPASADLVGGSDLGLVVDHHAEEGRQVIQLALHVRVQHTDNHTRHTSCEVQVCSHTTTPLQQQPKITALGSFSASTGIYIAASSSSSPSSPLVALSAAPEHQVLATYARTPPGNRQVDACRSHRGGSKRPVCDSAITHPHAPDCAPACHLTPSLILFGLPACLPAS